MFLIALHGNINCGISIQRWLFCYYILSSLQLFSSQLNDYLKNNENYRRRRTLRKVLKIVQGVFIEGTQVALILYGNHMFNQTNTCYEQAPLLTYFMLILLIIGFFQVIMYLVIIAVLICYCFAKCKRDRNKQVGSVRILKSLSRTKFSYQLFNEADECAICWNNYEDSDDIVKLQCNEKHFYHA